MPDAKPQLTRRWIDRARATTLEGAGPWKRDETGVRWGWCPRGYCRIGVGRQSDELALLESRNRPAVAWWSEGRLETPGGAVSGSVRPFHRARMRKIACARRSTSQAVDKQAGEQKSRPPEPKTAGVIRRPKKGCRSDRAAPYRKCFVNPIQRGKSPSCALLPRSPPAYNFFLSLQRISEMM